MRTHGFYMYSHNFIPITPTRELSFFFNDTATTEIYTLSLHDALPISQVGNRHGQLQRTRILCACSRPAELCRGRARPGHLGRSEEHTSELQSHLNLVCRLLLEKKQ